jgi:hypothetical protein
MVNQYIIGIELKRKIKVYLRILLTHCAKNETDQLLGRQWMLYAAKLHLNFFL